jgi:ABC-type antimicrobial peptide transport system permease subunit
LFGIVLGIISSEILNFGFNILAQSFGGTYTRLFSYPGWFIFFIMVISTSVGFIGGVGPARRAEKMNPLEALRYK